MPARLAMTALTAPCCQLAASLVFSAEWPHTETRHITPRGRTTLSACAEHGSTHNVVVPECTWPSLPGRASGSAAQARRRPASRAAMRCSHIAAGAARGRNHKYYRTAQTSQPCGAASRTQVTWRHRSRSSSMAPARGAIVVAFSASALWKYGASTRRHLRIDAIVCKRMELHCFL